MILESDRIELKWRRSKTLELSCLGFQKDISFSIKGKQNHAHNGTTVGKNPNNALERMNSLLQEYFLRETINPQALGWFSLWCLHFSGYQSHAGYRNSMITVLPFGRTVLKTPSRLAGSIGQKVCKWIFPCLSLDMGSFA
jgi:hypothetical protein